VCQQQCREAGSSRGRSWCASMLGGEGRAVCEKGPLEHRIKRRKMAAERFSGRREK